MYSKIMMIVALLFSSTLFAQAPHSKDRLLIKFHNAPDISKIKNISGHKHLFENVYVLYSHDIDTLYKNLKSDKNTIYAEYDYLGTKDKLAKVIPSTESLNSNNNNRYFNDTKIKKKWSFKDSDDGGIDVTKSYLEINPIVREDVIVAVIDTGVDYNHVDLKENMWINTGEIPHNNIDDDNNGYVDDIYGINTLIRDDDNNATVDVRDLHGHGTHVAGIIAATQNNKLGVAGIAKNAKIMAIRTVPNYGDEKDVDVIEALLYAARNGAKIINCSFGKSHNEGGNAVKDTLAYIEENFGVLVVVASGNSSRDIDQSLTYPASFDSTNLLVVASTTSSGGMSYFSNYGVVGVDLAAPGSSIYSLAPNNRYVSMSGTSMASPTVAGVAAEVLSQFPNLSSFEIKELLMETVTPEKKFEGKMVAAGRVNLFNALNMLYR